MAPYGEREWVKNARAAGEVELTRAGRTRRQRIEEVGPVEAAPVLREYLRTTQVVKPFFDAPADAPLDAFAAEATRHPVFRVLDEARRIWPSLGRLPARAAVVGVTARVPRPADVLMAGRWARQTVALERRLASAAWTGLLPVFRLVVRV